MIRPEVRELVELGTFPASGDAIPNVMSKQEGLLRGIVPPITDDEARKLVALFGPDEYYGASWSLVHLIESAPGWPLADCLSCDSNEWITRLKERAKRPA